MVIMILMIRGGYLLDSAQNKYGDINNWDTSEVTRVVYMIFIKP